MPVSIHHWPKIKIKEIQNNKKLPIVTGGSGLYIKSLTHGLLDLPPVDATLRQDLEKLSIEELVQKLIKIDPEGAPEHEFKKQEICDKSTRNIHPMWTAYVTNKKCLETKNNIIQWINYRKA